MEAPNVRSTNTVTRGWVAALTVFTNMDGFVFNAQLPEQNSGE